MIILFDHTSLLPNHLVSTSFIAFFLVAISAALSTGPITIAFDLNPYGQLISSLTPVSISLLLSLKLYPRRCVLWICNS
jgi:hypothetical protein